MMKDSETTAAESSRLESLEREVHQVKSELKATTEALAHVTKLLESRLGVARPVSNNSTGITPGTWTQESWNAWEAQLSERGKDVDWAEYAENLRRNKD